MGIFIKITESITVLQGTSEHTFRHILISGIKGLLAWDDRPYVPAESPLELARVSCRSRNHGKGLGCRVIELKKLFQAYSDLFRPLALNLMSPCKRPKTLHT